MGENQYLIQTSLICNLGTTLSPQFCSVFSVRDYYRVTGFGYLVPLGKAVMGDRETGISLESPCPVCSSLRLQAPPFPESLRTPRLSMRWQLLKSRRDVRRIYIVHSPDSECRGAQTLSKRAACTCTHTYKIHLHHQKSSN